MQYPFRNTLRFALAVTLAAGAQALSSAETATLVKPLANGITYTQEISWGTDPLLLNILKIDLKTPGIKVRYGQARDLITLDGETKGRESLMSMANRFGAIAAVNGDFAAYTADPLGVGVRDGELLSEPMDYRACMAITPQGEVLMDVLTSAGAVVSASGTAIPVHGINRVPHASDIIVFTPTYQAKITLEKPAIILTLKGVNLPLKPSQELRGRVSTVAPLAMGETMPTCPPDGVQIVGLGEIGKLLIKPFNPGEEASLRFDLLSNPTPDKRLLASRGGPRGGRAILASGGKPAWQEVEQAMGGGPWLVRDGAISMDGEAQGFKMEEFIAKRHPRTAAGVTADGKLLFVTVDGRQALSAGVSLQRWAGIMLRLGAVKAINLDGGGSSTMIVGGGVVNSPSDGHLRPLANGWLVFGTPIEAPAAEGAQIQPGGEMGMTMHLGDTQTFRVVDANGQPLDAPAPPIWGNFEGYTYISQVGTFTPTKRGTFTITAFVGGRTLRTTVTVD